MKSGTDIHDSLRIHFKDTRIPVCSLVLFRYEALFIAESILLKDYSNMLQDTETPPWAGDTKTGVSSDKDKWEIGSQTLSYVASF